MDDWGSVVKGVFVWKLMYSGDLGMVEWRRLRDD